MSVVVLVESIFHLHRLDVFVVLFPDPRDSYSYTSHVWRTPFDVLSTDVRMFCAVLQTEILVLLLVLRQVS